MLHGKRLVTGLAALSLLCGCSGSVKPAGGRGAADSPLTQSPDRVACLRAAHLPVQVLSPTEAQVGAPPAGATIKFAPTPGAAESLQIEGIRSDQGAEVIGAALLFPHQAPSGQLDHIENCLSQGVKEPNGGY